MPGSPDLSYPRARTAPPTVHLTCWPLRDEPLRTSLVGASVVGAGLVAGYATGRWLTGAVVSGLFLSASWPLWLPTKVELGAKGITRTVFYWRRRVPWSEFSQYETHPRGIFLWPQTPQKPFSTVHGLFLASKPPHAEVLAILDYYLRTRDADQAPLNDTGNKPGQ